jgi:hypothetical protein
MNEQEITDYLKAKEKSRAFWEKHSKEMPHITSFAKDDTTPETLTYKTTEI